MNNYQKISRILWLDVARVVALLSITVNHAVNRAFILYSDTSIEFNTITHGLTWVKTILNMFSRIGVPLFLMISGTLLLRKNFETTEDVKKFYKNNLLRLVITTECWYVIIYLVYLFFAGPLDYSVSGIFTCIWKCIQTMLFCNQITLGSLWYMPMIMAVYLVIPYMAIAVKKYSGKIILIPMTVVVIASMIIPNVNSILKLAGLANHQIVFAINQSNIYSMYMVYVIIGFYISKGILKNTKTIWILIFGVISFAICSIVQFWAFSSPIDYLVEYNFLFIMTTAVSFFELIRRMDTKPLMKIMPGIIYLSKISFAIFFLHRVIIYIMYKLFSANSIVFGHMVTFLIYELVPVLLSILIIAILSKNKWIKEYLFMIKD